MFSDLRFACRSLMKAPGFTVVAVFTLALGIGATVAIFSMVNAVLLRPLPYAQPEQLTRIYSEFPTMPNGGLRRMPLSRAEFLDLRREAESWQSIDAWRVGGANLATLVEPARVTASFVTGGLLPSMGVGAALGRVITPEDDEPGAAPVVVMSHRLWQRAFGSERGVVGRDVLLNGRQHTVVGIMPESFSFPPGQQDAPEIWAPMQIDPANPGERSSHQIDVLGRLRSGASLEQARAELDTLLRRWGENPSSQHPLNLEDHTLVTFGFHDEMIRGARPALRMLFGAVCFLLLIACVNVANLLLARAEARQREIAIRGALGAGAWRLASQFLTEGLVLACSGAAIGLLLAQGSMRLIEAANVLGLPGAADIGIDGRVVLFAVAISLSTGLAFGLTPLVHVLRRNLHDGMKTAAASATGSTSAQRFRQVLIVGQLALALVLLMGTGLMLRAFSNLQQVDAGFDPDIVVTMDIALPDSVYSGEAARSFWTRVQERLESLPGVQSVALMAGLPLRRPSDTTTMIEGYVPATGAQTYPTVDFYQVINQSYFDALRIRLIEGRAFDARDGTEAAAAIIINQTMAHMFWGNDSPLGRRIRPAFTDGWYTVVGVVADTRNYGMDKPAGTEIYLPYTQIPANWLYNLYLRNVTLAIRTHVSPLSIVGLVRREIRSIDPALPLEKVRTMEEVIAETQSRPQFLTIVLTLFASVALVLAAVGIYGVISYSVAQRTKEFGIRMALGAQHGSLVNLVLGRGLLLTACGVVIGLAGAFALTRLLSGFLFGVTATDPATFAAVSLLLAAIALLASYIPARRATRVDPLVALRAE